MMQNTMTGSRIAMKMQRLGELEQSLKRQSRVLMMMKQITAKVPLPMPKMRPS